MMTDKAPKTAAASSRLDRGVRALVPARLDDAGRHCGRKPLFYKGGSWRSPPGAPMYFCIECNREFGPGGEQRANWAWPDAVRRPEDDEAFGGEDQDAP